jgi:REP element-mobilizing transposase RayT
MTKSGNRSTRQLPLDLHERKERTHGGARAGAGRPRKKETERGFIAHRARASHRKDDPVHVTLRVRRRVPSLRRQAITGLVTRALLAQKQQLAKKQAKHFQVVHFSIQDDHVHLIVEASDKRGIARGVAGLEIRIARQLNKLLGRQGALWSERYHRRDLRTPTETRNALRYVLLNFQKHHRVIGEGAFADPCSSAATFDGFARTPTIFDDPSPWPRVGPRTWLLRTGFRRHGLLDPADIPASSQRRPSGRGR